MTEHEWNVKCKAAFLGLYAVRNLCADIKMNPYDLMDMLNQMLFSTSPTPPPAPTAGVTTDSQSTGPDTAGRA